MITRRVTYFVILIITVSSFSNLHCPTNKTCICKQSEDNFEINCSMKNNSSFFIFYNKPLQFIIIKCINSPDWIDIYLNATTTIKNEIKRMYFEKCNFSSKNNFRHVFDGLYALKDLKLPFNNLEKLPDFIFNNTKQLMYLHLSHNRITSLSGHLFDGLYNLKYLYLPFNNLEKLPDFIFNNTNQLERLVLSHNRITSLSGHVFDELYALEDLNLSYNNLEKLPNFIFNNTNQLKYLNLSHNRITSLSGHVFDGLYALEDLGLSSNNLEKLPDFIFNNTNQLNNLDLSNNNIMSLSEHVFDELYALEDLDLSSNNLEKLPDFIFNNTNQLNNLDLSNNNITSLSEHVFDGLYALEDLGLSSNNLKKLPDFIFNNTNQLKYLNLSNNNIMSLSEHVFDRLYKLKYLYLPFNNLEKLPDFIFNNTNQLERLVLSHNRITSLSGHVFDELYALEDLNLSYNNLEKLPDFIFNNTKQLMYLHLSHNRITSLSGHVFDGLYALEDLGLSSNNLEKLPDFIFNNTNQLKYLNLSNNNIMSLSEHVFDRLYKLKYLYLPFNNLEKLPDFIFNNTNQLERLVLSHNRITSLSGHVFNGLYNLKYLYLSSNNLKKLSVYIFQNINQLIYLDLSHNRITSLSEFVFEELKTLEELIVEKHKIGTNLFCLYLKNLRIAKFSNNRLTSESLKIYSFNFSFSLFIDCSQLTELYLANNNISTIFEDWKSSDSNLKILDLRYNDIFFLTTKDLIFQSNIRVDITYNRIQNIFFDKHVFDEYLIKSKNSNYKPIILLDNNPLICDCKIFDFLLYLEDNTYFTNSLTINAGNLTCQSPEKLKNVFFKNIKSDMLMCNANDIYPDTCKICNCFVRSKDDTLILDCSNKNLSSVSDDIKIHNGSVYVQQFELNFTNNQFTELPNLKNLQHKSIKNLILSHNKISKILLEELPKTVQILELDNNNMSKIDHNVLKFLRDSPDLNNLTLHKNPWTCNCDTVDFLHFIQTKIVAISGLHKVKCSGMNKFIWEMSETEFCPDKTVIIGVSIIIALGLLLLISSSVLFYYKYQQQIKVWLFAHQWCLWFVTEEELDKNKLYDAFVSYSHKDEDFVVNELVSKLENGPTPFKLCLHYRDWLVGEWIPTNIVRSVEDSKRTIVVLSSNFLESIWGRMEFRTAHCEALSEGRARVILILYGDIGPTDNLDSELKAYISMNTYIKWGDPWFWDKLRYALPHKTQVPRESMIRRKNFENNQLCIEANEDEKELMCPINMSKTLNVTLSVDV